MSRPTFNLFIPRFVSWALLQSDPSKNFLVNDRRNVTLLIQHTPAIIMKDNIPPLFVYIFYNTYIIDVLAAIAVHRWFRHYVRSVDKGYTCSVLNNYFSGHRMLKSEIQFDHKTLLYMLQSLIGISFSCNPFEDLICVWLPQVFTYVLQFLSFWQVTQNVYNFSILLISRYDIRDGKFMTIVSTTRFRSFRPHFQICQHDLDLLDLVPGCLLATGPSIFCTSKQCHF